MKLFSSSLVTVCEMLSALIQVTALPTGICITDGINVRWEIVTSALAAGLAIGLAAGLAAGLALGLAAGLAAGPFIDPG